MSKNSLNSCVCRKNVLILHRFYNKTSIYSCTDNSKISPKKLIGCDWSIALTRVSAMCF